MVFGKEVIVQTKGMSDIVNITSHLDEVIIDSGINDGIITAFVIGSTASVSTIEFEPALNKDMHDILEQLIPHSIKSRHSLTWGDDNGFSHMRATLMGPSLTIPFNKKEMHLGTWQQVIVIDHDNSPRNRRIHCQVIGE